MVDSGEKSGDKNLGSVSDDPRIDDPRVDDPESVDGDGEVDEADNSGTVVEENLRDPRLTYVDLRNIDVVVDDILAGLREDIVARSSDWMVATGGKLKDYNGKELPFSGEEGGVAGLVRLVDDKFAGIVKMILSAAVKGRDELEFEKVDPFRKDAATAFIYRTFLTYFYHYNRKRNDGRDYFEDHLTVGQKLSEDEEAVLGTTMIAIELMGQCGLVTLMGCPVHDDFEDIPDIDENNVVHVELWRHRLEKYDAGEIMNLTRRLSFAVEGVTKASDKVGLGEMEGKFGIKFHSHAEATFFNLLMGMKDEIKTVIIKLADRCHNMLRIMGHGDAKKRESVADGTVEVYLAIARMMQFMEIVKVYVDVGVAVKNPELYKFFHDAVSVRMAELGKTPPGDSGSLREAMTLDIVNCGEGVLSVSFVPDELEAQTQYFDRGFGELTPDDFSLNLAVNPMHEVVVLVDNKPGRITDVVRDMKRVLEFTESEEVSYMIAPVDSGAHWVKLADGTELVDSDGGEDGSVPNEGEEALSEFSTFVPRGISVNGFSSKYKRQMHVRVNDVTSEKRSRRGIEFDSRKGDVTEPLRKMAKNLVDLKVNNPEIDILRYARETFLSPRGIFKTPHGDIRIVPKGAPYAEGAFYVHSDLGVGLTAVRVSRGLTDGEGKGIKSVLDPIPFAPLGHRGKFPVLTFDSGIIGGKSRKKMKSGDRASLLDQIVADPGWGVFFKSPQGKKWLKNFFENPHRSLRVRGNPIVTIRTFGKEYVDRLARVFQFPVERVLSFFVDGSGLSSASEFYEGVGTLDLDIFMKLFNRFEFDKHFTVSASVVAESDDEEYIFKNMRAVGFSARTVARGESNDGLTRGKYIFSPIGTGRVDHYEVCKTILRLSYAERNRFDIVVEAGIRLKKDA